MLTDPHFTVRSLTIEMPSDRRTSGFFSHAQDHLTVYRHMLFDGQNNERVVLALAC